MPAHATPQPIAAATEPVTAVTYAVAATVALLVGQLSDAVGFGPAAGGTFGVLAVLALVSLRWAPRLRDTIEPRRPSI